MDKLLKSYIKMVISEGEEVRVPTQLLSPDKDDNNQNQMDKRFRDDRSRERGKNGESKKDEMTEFCAAGGGAIAGVSAGPITGHFTGIPSVKKRRKKKKNR